VTYDFVNPLTRNYIMFLQAERRGILGDVAASPGGNEDRPTSPILVSNRL